MIRVRRGETVTITLTDDESNAVPHSIDLHGLYGPGGAEGSIINPGETAVFRFEAMYPGVSVHHCAVQKLDAHISPGTFGAILVEPKGGVPGVDRELYFGHHEIDTDAGAGNEGHHGVDFEAMKAEDPSYLCLNGEAYAITPDSYGPVEVDKGERVRIFHRVNVARQRREPATHRVYTVYRLWNIELHCS